MIIATRLKGKYVLIILISSNLFSRDVIMEVIKKVYYCEMKENLPIFGV